MDETAKRRWDVWLGIVGPIITVAGVLVGVWQYIDGEERKAAYEHASRLWTKRLETYSEVAKQAGRIAAPSSPESAKAAFDEFMSLYWGEMILIEDPEVEGAMKDFRAEVEDYHKGRSNADRLKIRADALMKALKTSITARAPRP